MPDYSLGASHPLRIKMDQERARRAQAALPLAPVQAAPDPSLRRPGEAFQPGEYRAQHPTGGIDSGPGRPGLRRPPSSSLLPPTRGFQAAHRRTSVAGRGQPIGVGIQVADGSEWRRRALPGAVDRDHPVGAVPGDGVEVGLAGEQPRR